MIRRLRLKFIAVTMLSLFLVLAVILGCINLFNYRRMVEEADATLDLLEQNGGEFPNWDKFYDPGKPGGFSAELPFKSRYFSVRLSEDGEVLDVDTQKVYAVDEAAARELAEEIAAGGRKSGFIGDYRFRVCPEADGGVLILALSCEGSIRTSRSFLLNSCAVAAAGMLAVFLLLVVSSKVIIRPVAESYEKQKRFITDAGHEIKTPLTIIEADAELLGMESGESEWLEDIQRQTRRLTALTNDLIQLSRMEEGDNRLTRIELLLSDLVAEEVQSWQGRALAAGKTLTARIQPMLAVSGDEKSLRQLVSIFLDNAVKYSAGDGAIDLVLEKQGRSVRLTVSNPAEGLDGEKLSQLFERFYRGDASRSSDTGGYGLGLAIAGAIVAAHKGKIAASSRDGKSLTISVTLPAAKLPEEEA